MIEGAGGVDVPQALFYEQYSMDTAGRLPLEEKPFRQIEIGLKGELYWKQ